MIQLLLFYPKLEDDYTKEKPLMDEESSGIDYLLQVLLA
jgi:hypothetical protein